MRPRILLACGFLWLAAVVAGTGLMLRFQNTPGRSAEAPPVWPEESRLHREPGTSTLILVAHPKCPCLGASLEELARLLAQSPARVTAHVVFFKPAEAGDDWPQTAAWRAAAAIPGVTVSTDDAGDQARLFGCETAGDTVFYDARGRLRFHGGITASRGEAGDNAGRTALDALLRGESPPQVRTPVFGCPLLTAGSNAASTFASWKK